MIISNIHTLILDHRIDFHFPYFLFVLLIYTQRHSLLHSNIVLKPFFTNTEPNKNRDMTILLYFKIAQNAISPRPHSNPLVLLNQSLPAPQTFPIISLDTMFWHNFELPLLRKNNHNSSKSNRIAMEYIYATQLYSNPIHLDFSPLFELIENCSICIYPLLLVVSTPFFLLLPPLPHSPLP